MSDAGVDDVVRVHLRVTSCRRSSQLSTGAGTGGLNASIVNTSSTSGLLSNPGQTNYGAAKSGIATFTEICQKELGRYGVRSKTPPSPRPPAPG